MDKASCNHLDSIKDIKTSSKAECFECMKTGDSWVNLRTCQECGLTLCCDSSVNKHATAHFKATGHPVMSSAMPGEKWMWCFVDEVTKNY